jgi:D-sedoheptulose 7-phosphate isomerase
MTNKHEELDTQDIITKIKQSVQDSIVVKQKLLENQPLMNKIAEVTQLIIKAYQNGNKLLIAGNGGSAADAQHMAAEFVSRFYFDRPALPAIALTVDTSALTAIGNDYGFEKVFLRQVQAHGQRGDIYFAISTSGNSRNIVESLKCCKDLGITSVGLVSEKPCEMDGLCDYILKVDSTITPRIQETHILIEHIICEIVESKLYK